MSQVSQQAAPDAPFELRFVPQGLAIRPDIVALTMMGMTLFCQRVNGSSDEFVADVLFPNGKEAKEFRITVSINPVTLALTIAYRDRVGLKIVRATQVVGYRYTAVLEDLSKNLD